MEAARTDWDEGETRLDRVLETVVERAKSLVDARTVMVLLEDRGLLVVAATTGEYEVERRGVRLQADGSAWRRVMASAGHLHRFLAEPPPASSHHLFVLGKKRRREHLHAAAAALDPGLDAEWRDRHRPQDLVRDSGDPHGIVA